MCFRGGSQFKNCTKTAVKCKKDFETKKTTASKMHLGFGNWESNMHRLSAPPQVDLLIRNVDAFVSSVCGITHC